MRSNVVGSSVLVTVLAILLSGFAAAAAESDLDKRITLKLEDAPVKKIFDTYRQILEVELDIDPTIDGDITISFENITVRTSLNAVCESAGCNWELITGDPDLLRVDRDDLAASRQDGPSSGPHLQRIGGKSSTPEIPPGDVLTSPVSLELIDADATSVLKLTAELIGAKLLVDKDLEGKTISVNVTGVALSSVLDTMCAQLDCVWNLTEGEPPVLDVYQR
jgi:type II secretory pathway component GspD/PulD (secretin)